MNLFSESLYQIPDYQRGYAWEEKHWDDFIQDLDALVEEDVNSHYTGTIVVYANPKVQPKPYGATKRFKSVDVVDGQQRLTTSCLYLSVILNKLLGLGESAFQNEVADFLYAGTTCKLTLNNDTENVFYDLLKNGRVNTHVDSTHAKRLVLACEHFQKHINTQLTKRGRDAGIEYLKNLFYAITQKMSFTYYVIEEECEIGMTFELMNSRGKDLSVLELLKNYLMHWVSRNVVEDGERQVLTAQINKSWKDTYTNIGSCDGEEDQCLRIAWTLYCTHAPANWIGYKGFKQDEYIPLRNFSKRSKPVTMQFIARFAEGLAEISRQYAIITRPTAANTLHKNELIWLTKIHHTGNIANFLPVMVAARKYCEAREINLEDYISFLKALECYAYRVFMYDGRRSNTGKSSFFRWGYQVFTRACDLQRVTSGIHNLTRHYASEKSFHKGNSEPGDWYSSRRLLKYTLFEYELHLLATEGQGKEPLLTWAQLSDSTLEHILPQTRGKDSHWKAVWSKDDYKDCLHDIGNIVLTQDNSSYSNFEFVRKKGRSGIGPSYCNSDIRQERRISVHQDWTPAEFYIRRNELVSWINERWKTEQSVDDTLLDVIVDSDEADADNPALLEAEA